MRSRCSVKLSSALGRYEGSERLQTNKAGKIVFDSRAEC